MSSTSLSSSSSSSISSSSSHSSFQRNERISSQSLLSSSSNPISQIASSSLSSSVSSSNSSPINISSSSSIGSNSSKKKGTKRKPEDTPSSSGSVSKMLAIASKSSPIDSNLMMQLSTELCNGKLDLYRSIIDEKDEEEISEILKYEIIIQIGCEYHSATIFSLIVRYCSVSFLEEVISDFSAEEIYIQICKFRETCEVNLLEKLFYELHDSFEEKAAILLKKIGVASTKLLLKERNEKGFTPLMLLYYIVVPIVDRGQEVYDNTSSFLICLIELLLSDNPIEDFPEELILFLDRMPKRQSEGIWKNVFDEYEQFEKFFHNRELLFPKLLLCYHCPISIFKEQLSTETFQRLLPHVQGFLPSTTKITRGPEILAEVLEAMPKEVAEKLLFEMNHLPQQLVISSLLLDEMGNLNVYFFNMFEEKFPDFLFDWLSFICPEQEKPEILRLNHNTLLHLVITCVSKALHLNRLCELLHNTSLNGIPLIESIFSTDNQGSVDFSLLINLCHQVPIKSFVSFIKTQSYQDGTLLSKAVEGLYIESPEFLEYANSRFQDVIPAKVQQLFVNCPFKLALLVWNGDLDLVSNIIKTRNPTKRGPSSYFDCLNLPHLSYNEVYPLAFALIYSNRTINRIWNIPNTEYIIAILQHKNEINDLLHFIGNGEFVEREVMAKAFSNLNWNNENILMYQQAIKNMMLNYGLNISARTHDTPLEYFASTRNLKILDLLCKSFGETEFGMMVRHRSVNSSNAFQKILVSVFFEGGAVHSNFLTKVLEMAPKEFFKSLQIPYFESVNKKILLKNPFVTLISNMSADYRLNYEIFLNALRAQDLKLFNGRMIPNLLNSQTIINCLNGDDPISISKEIISKNKIFVLEWFMKSTREVNNVMRVLGAMDQRGGNPLFYAITHSQWKLACHIINVIRIANQLKLIPQNEFSYKSLRELHSKTTEEVVNKWLLLLATDPEKQAKPMAMHLLSLYVTLSPDTCLNIAEGLPINNERGPSNRAHDRERFISPLEMLADRLTTKLDSEMANTFFEELFAQCPQMFVGIDTTKLMPADFPENAANQDKTSWTYHEQQLRIQIATELLRNKEPEVAQFYRSVITAKYNIRFGPGELPTKRHPNMNYTEVLKQYRYFYNVNQILLKLQLSSENLDKEQMNKELSAVARIYDPRTEETTKLVPKYFKDSQLKTIYGALLLIRDGLLIPLSSRIAEIPGTLFQRMMAKGKSSATIRKT